MNYRFTINEANWMTILGHLELCSDRFVPPLHTTVDLETYARKIHASAERFEAWDNGILVGLVAAYLNDPSVSRGFITDVSVVPGHTGKGLAKELVLRCTDRAMALGFATIGLEVAQGNHAAVKLYHNLGFESDPSRGDKALVKKLKPT